ncbi:Serine/threonine-protein kinase env7 [Marasmius tenuissimus]|uniref:non-specific serine/threonine protein kinase n=1 Tax=Marasmius tenuissimus TaxID=585030 RepID=A0ABR2ZVZ4_9AGAR
MALPSNLLRTLDSLKDQAKDAIWALSSFNIVKVLGEGGFSFVYLAQDEHSGRQFALKKIRCPTGSEGVKEAMREVEAYRRFKHPNIIKILDSAVVQDPDGEGKIVYLFLPLYKRGNLQDSINANVVNNTHFSEREMLRLFKGTCEAIRAMHTYRPPKSRVEQTGGSSATRQEQAHDEDDDARFPEPEGEGGEGHSYGGGGGGGGSGSSNRTRGGASRSGSGGEHVPLVSRDDLELVFDGDEQLGAP